MKKITLTCVFIFCLFNICKIEATNSVLTFMSSQTLFSYCKKMEEGGLDFYSVSCSTYIMGVSDTFTTELDSQGVDTICYSKKALAGVTPYQIGKMFVKYLTEHPENLNTVSADIIRQLKLKYFPIPQECYTK